MPSFKSPSNINETIHKLFNTFQKPMLINGNEFYVTLSIGLSVCPNDGETVESLLQNADLAMYKSKEGGRNCY